jgi:hypothetical protein
VVPISGGKDSTFILYYIVRELGLKPIALNYDSGFQTEFARENVQNACRILGVPLVTLEAPGYTQSRVLKQWIQLSEKLGRLYGPCGGNCEAILRTAAIKTARSQGTPFVIWGSSALESKNYTRYVNRGKRQHGAAATRLKEMTTGLNSLASDLRKVRKIPKMIYPFVGYHAIMFGLASIYQRFKLGFPYRYALKPRYVPPFTDRDPVFVHFFDYISWDSISNTDVLKNELKWRHPESRDSRFDCIVHCLGNQEHLRTYGITADGANYCNFIREGKIDRKTATNNEKMIAASVDGEVEELLQKVGLKGYRQVPYRITRVKTANNKSR